VDPALVDVLMGTFTKSFGGMGGYIAGSRALCDHLRDQCPAFVHHSALSPVVARQVTAAWL
jgi:serine palmitoyltransferase